MSSGNGWSEEPTNPRLRIAKPQMMQKYGSVENAVTAHERSLKDWRYLNVALVLSVLVALGGFYKFVLAGVDDKADAGVKAAARVAAKLEEHEKDDAQDKRELRAELSQVKAGQYEQMLDMRALYDFQRTGRRQRRLEVVPDAGR